MKQKLVRILKSSKLFEFLMIFAGITLSMQFDNWNENRKLQQKEVELLKILYIDVCNDQKDLGRILESYDRYYLSHFTHLDSCLHHKIEKKDYKEIFIPIGNSYINQDKGAYESLKYEDSNVFRNIQLKVKIYDYYEARLNWVETNFKWKDEISTNYIIPLSLKYCDDKLRINYEKFCQLKKDKYSLQILTIWHKAYQQIQQEYLKMDQHQRKLKLALEQELKKFDVDSTTFYTEN